MTGIEFNFEVSKINYRKQVLEFRTLARQINNATTASTSAKRLLDVVNYTVKKNANFATVTNPFRAKKDILLLRVVIRESKNTAAYVFKWK